MANRHILNEDWVNRRNLSKSNNQVFSDRNNPFDTMSDEEMMTKYHFSKTVYFIYL